MSAHMATVWLHCRASADIPAAAIVTRLARASCRFIQQPAEAVNGRDMLDAVVHSGLLLPHDVEQVLRHITHACGFVVADVCMHAVTHSIPEHVHSSERLLKLQTAMGPRLLQGAEDGSR